MWQFYRGQPSVHPLVPEALLVPVDARADEVLAQAIVNNVKVL